MALLEATSLEKARTSTSTEATTPSMHHPVPKRSPGLKYDYIFHVLHLLCFTVIAALMSMLSWSRNAGSTTSPDVGGHIEKWGLVSGN
uniref:Uncharacterized protein n=1 Tax=Oryza barthii TaxID=65489 RepID=A0A0D3F581_9ORYZ